MLSRGTLRRFYGSAAWRDLKGAALYLKGRRCALCGRTDRPFHVDHIVPARVAWAARLSMANLQVLCVPCHGGKKRRSENAKWRRRK